MIPEIAPEHGLVTTAKEDDGKLLVGYYQDASAILDNNKRLQTLNDGYNPDRDMRRVASIPTVAFYAWCKQRGLQPRHVLQNWKHYRNDIRKMVYDPDNRAFLTAPHSTAAPKFRGLDEAVSQGRRLGT